MKTTLRHTHNTHSLLLLLALLMLAPVGMWGQTRATKTICDGTKTNEYVPFYGWYADAYQKCEFVIPSTTSGMSDLNGKTITKMTFYVSSYTDEKNGGPSTGTFRVFLYEISGSTHTAFLSDTHLSNVHDVYTGTLSVSSSGMEVIFDSDKYYTYGGGNLLIGFHESSTGGYAHVNFYGVSSSNTTVQGYSSSGLSSCSPGAQDFLPKITFTYTSCSAPSDPAFSPAGGNYNSTQNVTLSCAKIDATIRYTIFGTNPTSSSTAYSSAISVSSTTTIKAKAFKDGCESDVVSATYTINAGTTVWAETTTITTGQDYLIGFSYNGSVYLAVNYAVNESNHYYTSANSNNYYGYTAQAAIDGNGYVTGVSGYATDLTYCKWKFTSDNYIQSSYQTNYYLKGYTSSNYADLYPQTSSQAWTYNSSGTLYNGSYYAEYIDVSGPHMRVTSSPASTVKLYTQQTAPTTHTVTLNSWPASIGATLTGSGSQPEGSHTITAIAPSGYQFVNWTSSDGNVVSPNASYTFNLSGDVTYQANFTSTTPITITASTPWTENFDGYTHGSGKAYLKGEWATPERSSMEPCCNNYSYGATSGNYSVEMRNSCMLVLPQFNQKLNTLTLSYSLGRGSGSSGGIELGYVDPGTSISTFNKIADLDLPGSTLNSHTSYTYVLSEKGAPANSSYRLAIRCTYNESLFFDDFKVTYTAPAVISSVSTSCDNSATVIWSGSSSTYKVEYKTSAEASWTTAVSSTSGSSYTITGLSAGTAYQVRVTGNNTAASAVSDFTTSTCYTVTYDKNHSSASGTMTDDDSPYTSGSTVTVKANSFTAPSENYIFGGWNTAADGSGTRYVAGNTFTISANTTLYAIWAPLSIANTTQWNEFCTAVNSGFDYSGRTVTMTDNVGTAETPVSIMAGTSSHPFRGTFDGNCHTLTVGISSNEQGAAPFHYISEATIQNLKVTGTVTATAHHAGGLVGFADNNSPNYIDAPLDNNVTITNCLVHTNVTNTSGNNYIGGIIGHNKCVKTTIEGCVYDGKLTSSGYKGGMIGWSDRSTLTVRNTYFGGSYSTNSNFSPIGCKTQTQNSSNVTLVLTFSNFYYNQDAGTFDNSAYNALYNASPTGTAKHAYTITAGPCVTVARSGNATTYSCSGITAYTNGIVYDGAILGGDGDAITLNLGYDVGSTVTPSAPTLEGYTADHGTLGSGTHTGTDDAYTLTMAAANATITADVSCSAYTVTASTPWTENFTWDLHGASNARQLDEYPDNCWYVPNTINVSGSYTKSPRIWHDQWLSMKSNGESGDDQIVVLPEFTNPINALRISFKAYLASSGSRTLEIGYYNMGNSTFTELQEVEVNTTSFTSYGPLALTSGPSTYNSDYRIAIRFPASAEISCNVDDVVVSLSQYEVTASANPSAGGSVTGAGTFGHGESCTIVADANECYTFTNWTEGGSVVSTSASYTFSVTADRTLVANFTLNTNTITTEASPAAGGSVTGGGTFDCGTTATLTATANTGYAFSKWSDNNTDNPRTVTVNGDATYTAIFALDTWVDAVDGEPDGFALNDIDSPEDLAWVISLVNGYNEQVVNAAAAKNVTITADLDMSAHTWVPIGEEGTPYLGTFDGGFHTISGLHIANADEIEAVENTPLVTLQDAGLFGVTDENATIKNLYVKGAVFANSESSGTLGGIVGNNGGTVQNCYSDATLSGSGTTNIGGIAGANTGTLKNSYTMVTSGVCGDNADGTITHCYNKAATNSNPGTGEFTSAVAYSYGDYTTNNAANDGTTLKPLVDWLNTSNPDNTVKWIRPKGSLKINDGYPVLVEASSSGIMAVVGVTDDNNIHKGDANAMITTYGANSNADIYVYGGGTLTTKPTNASLFIDEDASIKLDGVSNVTATVGITIDNSANNGEMGRDWHCFATPLNEPVLGITYTNETQYTTSSADNAHIVEGDAFNISTATNSYLAGLVGNADDDLDYYDFYEPQYHWINLKRNKNSHWHQDNGEQIFYDQGSVMQSGKGYLIAVGNNTAAKRNVYLSATGTLKDGTVTAIVTNAGEHMKGYNLLGNPYQSYLDFNRFADYYIEGTVSNADSLWTSGSTGSRSYLIYDADEGRFNEYLYAGSGPTGQSFSQGAAQTASQYIHPHQAFFVVKNTSTTNDTATVTFTDDMRTTTGWQSTYRDAQPNYPLVNLFCTDSDGKKEVSVIEVERPIEAGSLKVKELLCGKANMYIRWNNEDYSNMFIEGTPEYVPVWFKSIEEGVFTMSWSTANDNFGYLHLIDNLTGNDIDMLTTDSYAFQSKPSDSKARFRLVFKPLGIEEETTSEQGENFAFINGNELVVTGEGELSLIDLNGRVLATEYVSGQQSHIAMPKVAVGMYMLRLSNSDGVKVQKIVVRK